MDTTVVTRIQQEYITTTESVAQHVHQVATDQMHVTVILVDTICT